VNINSYISFDNQRDEFERVKLKKGDIVISTVGSKPEVVAAVVGQLASVNGIYSGSYLNQNTVCIRPVSCVNASFLKYAFEEMFIDKLIERMDQNQEIFEKILEDQSFGGLVKELMMKKVYARLNENAK